MNSSIRSANAYLSHHHHPARAQRGVALFVVLVFVMLSMLLALWASRTSLFSEMVVGNDADYQRAFEATQALLQDAELDIRGETANGTPYDPAFCVADICRKTTIDKIPIEAKEVSELLSDLETRPTRCRNGLCAKRVGRQDFWNFTGTATPPADASRGEVPLSSMTSPSVGARYGQYTGASYTNTAATPSNPILADRSANDKGGWYWIEVLPYDDSSKNSGVITGISQNLLPLNLTPSVVYRVTALAYGRKPSTMVVIQQTYAPQKRKD
jgi:type IV pilus assembly protein PilX